MRTRWSRLERHKTPCARAGLARRGTKRHAHAPVWPDAAQNAMRTRRSGLTHKTPCARDGLARCGTKRHAHTPVWQLYLRCCHCLTTPCIWSGLILALATRTLQPLPLRAVLLCLGGNPVILRHNEITGPLVHSLRALETKHCHEFPLKRSSTGKPVKAATYGCRVRLCFTRSC